MAKQSGYDGQGRLEVVLQVRDLEGNPTGKTRSFRTELPDRLSSWYEQNAFRKKVIKPKGSIDKNQQISGDAAEEILAELYKEKDDETT